MGLARNIVSISDRSHTTVSLSSVVSIQLFSNIDEADKKVSSIVFYLEGGQKVEAVYDGEDHEKKSEENFIWLQDIIFRNGKTKEEVEKEELGKVTKEELKGSLED